MSVDKALIFIFFNQTCHKMNYKGNTGILSFIKGLSLC